MSSGEFSIAPIDAKIAFADRGLLLELEVGDRAPHELPLVGRRNEHLRVAGERHEPEPEPRGQRIDEGANRALRGRMRVGSTSVARIDCDTSTASITVAVSRGTWIGARRPRERHDDEHQREQQARRREVASPSRPVRRDRREQVDVGEAHRVLAALALHEHVRDRERRRRRGAARAGSPRGNSSRRCHPSRRAGACASTTYLARSRSQSRSVRSTTCSAPAPRMSRAIRRALACRGLGVASPDLLARGLHLDAATGFGVDERRRARPAGARPRAGRGSRPRARRGGPPARARRAASRSRSGSRRSRPRGRGDARARATRAQRAPQVTRRRPRVLGARHRVDLVQQREHRFATGARRDEERAVVPEHERADAVPGRGW